MPLTRLVIALAVVLASGCSRAEPEAAAEGSTNGANNSINKLNETRKTLGAIDAQKRKQDADGAEGQAP